MTGIDQATDLFRMPALGADMVEGRVIEWLVEEGGTAARGDLVAVIETDKSDIEIEVFDPCTFDEFLVELGDAVRVGDPIARVTLLERAAAGAATLSEVDRRIESHGAESDGVGDQGVDGAPGPTVVTPHSTVAPADSLRSGRRVSPRARRLAAERGVDLKQFDTDRTVTGDMIERTDRASTVTARTDRSATMRRAIASLMERSWHEIPHYHVTSTLDLTDVQHRLEQDNATRDIADRVVTAAVVNVAIARAAASTNGVNGWWEHDGFTPSRSVDLGLILSLRTGGIVVPTIHQANLLDPVSMMQTMRELVERARRGRLREADLRPASISVTSMGDLGADSVLGVIYPPQVTLIGVGTPRRRPAIVGDEVVARLLADLTITGDHRAHDGLIASRFARNIASLLEELP